MDIEHRSIDLGPVVGTLWGRSSGAVTVVVHGKHSHQQDEDVRRAVADAVRRGRQALTFDLPGHGERPGAPADLRVSDAATELDSVWVCATSRFDDVSVFATSLGAWLTLVTALRERLSSAAFLSPVVDLAGMVDGMLAGVGSTPGDLERDGRIETPWEPLEWDQFRFIHENPLDAWSVPTRILRGSDDDMVDATSVEAFCERTGARLTVVPGAAHHFHTASNLAALDAWLAGA